MREVVSDGLGFGFWVVLVVCLVGLLVAGWFGVLLGFATVFLFGYGGCCVVLFAGFRVLVWKLCLLLCSNIGFRCRLVWITCGMGCVYALGWWLLILVGCDL